MKTCKKCESEFEKRCRKCAREDLRRWREKQRAAGKSTYTPNPHYRRDNQKYWSTLKGRMTKILVHARARSKDHRYSNGDRFATFDIDRQYLLDLWEEQSGRCALSKLEMNLDQTSLKCVSLDRKIQSIGYVRGNVQLVCRFANLAKHTHPDEDIKAVFLEMLQGYAGGYSDMVRAGN